ncbi:hypothetical protein MES5069_310186 [Mesorhizobium escarrei]|uniref:Propionyl-coenzyme A carboxylase alpha polypeptide n=1 Tax=Mesorhizobium escarrei TaxID=666018 RepID=A0ABN8JX23_9HYPH|nr:hypothetical protein MES5069_310186 [Mesorhizobium escarrei]
MSCYFPLAPAFPSPLRGGWPEGPGGVADEVLDLISYNLRHMPQHCDHSPPKAPTRSARYTQDPSRPLRGHPPPRGGG